MSRDERIIRWLIAILWVVTAFGSAVTLYFGGLLIGTFATDACGSLPDWSGYYLFACWPLVMLVSILVPAILMVRKTKWYVVLGAVVGGVVLSVAWWFGWPLILQSVC